MNRLGLLDQAMFKIEQWGMSPFYMCGAMVLDTARSTYPVDSAVIGDHLAACMEEIPLMRQRIVQDPLRAGDLRLVDDPDFDVRKHITYSTADAPGKYEQLTDILGRFSAQRMDLNRPLWRYEVIDGLANGQIAIATQIHHAILDGLGAQRALGGMLSPEPSAGRKPRMKAWHADKTPSSAALLSGALLENLQRLYIQAPTFLLRNAKPIVKTATRQLPRLLNTNEKRQADTESKALKVHKTSLNVAPISAGRAVAYVEFPLDEIKGLRRAFDCSVNDLALMLSCYSLENYFEATGENIDFDLVAGMPLNLREEGDSSAGNDLAVSRLSLHNTRTGVRQRLQAISADTAAIKQRTRPTKDSGGAENTRIDIKALTGLFSPLVLDVLLAGAARFNLMDKAALVNVVVTNVPGQSIPMYVAGARLHTMIPMAPPADSMALIITVTSTEGRLIIGYHGCAEAVKDKDLLVQGARKGFQAMKRAARRRGKAAATP